MAWSPSASFTPKAWKDGSGNTGGDTPVDKANLQDGETTDVNYVMGQMQDLATYVDTQDATKAPLASPALTGTPTAPEPALTDSSGKLATTSFVIANLPDRPFSYYGGVGDGIADDTTALNNMASVNGLRANLQGKTPRITTNIQPTGQNQVWDLRGGKITMDASQVTSAIFSDASNTDGTTLKREFTLLGGELVGNGQWAGTLSAGLTSGSNYGTIPVNALTQPIGAGVTFYITDPTGVHTQSWVASSAAGIGAVSVSVTAQNATYSFPSGSNVYLNYGNRHGVTLRQWENVRIIGTKVHDFAGSCLSFENCTNVFLDGPILYNAGTPGNVNVCNFRDYPPNLSTLARGFFARGVKIPTGAVNGGINIGMTYGGVQGSEMNPLAIVEQCQIVVPATAFMGLGLEVGEQGGTQSYASYVIWANNIVVGNARSALFFQDDGSAPTNDPTKLQDLTIVNNYLRATAAGGYGVVHGAASHSTIRGNRIVDDGTGMCIGLFPNAADTSTVFTDMNLEGNDLRQTNASPTKNIIDGSTTQWSKVAVKGGSLRGAKTTVTQNALAEFGPGVTMDNPRTAFPLTSAAAGASPYTIGPFITDKHIAISNLNGGTVTAFSLGAPLATVVGSGGILRRGDTGSITYTGSAPTLVQTPLP